MAMATTGIVQSLINHQFFDFLVYAEAFWEIYFDHKSDDGSVQDGTGIPTFSVFKKIVRGKGVG